jgi:tellurite resistance protein TerA
VAELKRKVTLENKGDEAFVSVQQLIVTLSWTAEVDLDLMAFYKTKDGNVGGVFSDNYPGGSMGNLNSFPFIQLSGDEGIGAKGGANEEKLRITKLADFAVVYIVTLNYTDASQGIETSFNKYDGKVRLNSAGRGTVAVVCKIDNSSAIGAKLINMNDIMDLDDFAGSIPGANLIVGR